MKILQLCNKSPIPPKEGGSIAMFHLAGALTSHGHSVDLLTVSTPKYLIDNEYLTEHKGQYSSVQSVYIDTRVKLLPAAMAFLRSAPYHIERFFSNEFCTALVQRLKKTEYDVIIFETLSMAPYLKIARQHSKAFCVLRSHNIEHQIWERAASEEKNLMKKKYLQHLSRTLSVYEKKITPDFDAIACISEAEQIYFRIIAPGCNAAVVPFGFPLANTPIHCESNIGFYHIGSMDWLPNQEGVKWFVEKVVPLLKEQHKFQIFLAGRNMPEWVYRYESKMLHIVGEVNDANEFIANKAVLLVPLFSGSGIRIKIIEAMNLGKAVISTSIGAEGICAHDKTDIILADTPEEFASAMLKMVSNPGLPAQIGKAASELVRQYHSYDVAYHAFLKIVGK